MRTLRLHVDQALDPGRRIELRDEALHYARNVLRLEAGTSLRLFNGDGREFSATIESSERRLMCIVIETELSFPPGHELAVHLGIGLSRGERMDWAIQKATELGVTAITPLLLERCNAKFDPGRSDNRLRHWRQIIIGAAEQSGRRCLPCVENPLSLEAWLASRGSALGLVLHTSDSSPLTPGEPPSAIHLLVGPEGGLSEVEFRSALDAGFSAWSLGPRVLRTETAPVAALAVLQFLWGDMREPVQRTDQA